MGRQFSQWTEEERTAAEALLLLHPSSSTTATTKPRPQPPPPPPVLFLSRHSFSSSSWSEAVSHGTAGGTTVEDASSTVTVAIAPAPARDSLLFLVVAARRQGPKHESVPRKIRSKTLYGQSSYPTMEPYRSNARAIQQKLSAALLYANATSRRVAQVEAEDEDALSSTLTVSSGTSSGSSTCSEVGVAAPIGRYCFRGAQKRQPPRRLSEVKAYKRGKEPEEEAVVDPSSSDRRKNCCVISSSMRRKEAAILELLRRKSCWTSEQAIRGAIGNTPDTSKALRMLLKTRQIIRSGGGGRFDPFLYKLTTIDHIQPLD